MIDFKTSFQTSRDKIYTSDPHTISGFVKIMGNIYPFAPVRLYERLTGRLIKQAAADSNGYYFFNGISKSIKYTIISIDNNGLFNAVIQDNVVPK